MNCNIRSFRPVGHNVRSDMVMFLVLPELLEYLAVDRSSPTYQSRLDIATDCVMQLVEAELILRLLKSNGAPSKSSLSYNMLYCYIGVTLVPESMREI